MTDHRGGPAVATEKRDVTVRLGRCHEWVVLLRIDVTEHEAAMAAEGHLPSKVNFNGWSGPVCFNCEIAWDPDDAFCAA